MPDPLRGLAPLLVLVVLASGCSHDWQQKFIRKKKSEKPAPAHFYSEADYRPYPELYKEHFIYWKSWHKQLLEDLEGNYKAVRQDVYEARRHLDYLAKYVTEEKALIALEKAEAFERVTASLLRRQPSSVQAARIRNDLQALLNSIGHELDYRDMEEFYLPTPPPLDAGRYAGPEPVLDQPAPVKEEEKPADSLMDENGNLTYEDYRAAPVS